MNVREFSDASKCTSHTQIAGHRRRFLDPVIPSNSPERTLSESDFDTRKRFADKLSRSNRMTGGEYGGITRNVIISLAVPVSPEPLWT